MRVLVLFDDAGSRGGHRCGGRAAVEADGRRQGVDDAQPGRRRRAVVPGSYWTATESGAETAWFYNFGRNGVSLNRHADGEKLGAFSVRCIRD